MKIICFVWKLVHIVSQGCWFQMYTYIFDISTSKSIFEQIWAQKFEIVRFVWKLLQIVAEGWGFRF